MDDNIRQTRPLLCFPTSPPPPVNADQSRGQSGHVGETIGDRYLVIEALPGGAAGSVYRVRDLQLDREVVLKLLVGSGPAGGNGGGPAERIVAEARALARLDHPGIVPVHDAGEIDGTPFLTMALIRGRALSEVLDEEGPLRPRRALGILRQVCQALDYAHRHGVLHCDLKPGNIVLEDGDRVRLIDFGLARLRSDLMGNQGDLVMGTAGYTAPEVIRGDAPGPRSDIFSAGAVLYRMLSGRHAFEGRTTPEILDRVQGEEPPALESARKGMPRGLGRVTARSLAKFPEHRFPDGASLTRAVERVLLLRKATRIVAAACALLVVTASAFALYRATRPLEIDARLLCEDRTPDGQYVTLSVQDGARLHAGDRLWFSDIVANRSAFVQVFMMDGAGVIVRHFPSEQIPVRLPLKARETHQIPPGKLRWVLDDRRGPETIILAASLDPVPDAEPDALSARAGGAPGQADHGEEDPLRGALLVGANPSARKDREAAVERLLRERFPVVQCYRFIHE